MTAHHRTRIIVAAIVVVGLGLLLVQLGCGGQPSADPETQPLVLRSYRVDPGVAPELTSVLSSLLAGSEGQPARGRARLGPDGQVLVAAPASFQAGVEQVVDEMRSASPVQPQVVDLTYWVAVGKPTTGAASWSRRLDDLQPALESVVAAEGPMRFELMEKLQLRSLTGEFGEIMGRDFSIRQNAARRQERIFANVRLRALGSGGAIETTINLRPGQTLALGQSGVPQRGDPSQDDQEATLFVLVRASADEGPINEP